MKYLRPAIILLLTTILAYGLLIPKLGFYWDDLPITWIRYELGRAALVKYFSTNRPIWGLLHQLTTSVIPQVPAYWQIFALLWRWAGAVVVYAIVAKLWREKPRTALGIALLFLVYPGFNQEWAAYLFSHFFIVLFFFLFSFLCMLKASESPDRYWQWTITGMIFSVLNLWMMEYFYVLELVRIGVILTTLRHEPLPIGERIVRALKLWAPYLIVFILAVLSRLFIFNNQVYGIGLTAQLKSAPIETLKSLTQTIWFTFRLVLRNAWLQVFDLSDVAANVSILRSYILVVAFVMVVVAAGFLIIQHNATRILRENLLDALWMIGLGGLAIFLAGWPFWLIGFHPSLAWPTSRFTLSFMLGVSLIFGGLIHLIPWEKLQILLLVALVGLAAGRQYLTSIEYARDWATQKDLFWQMIWRAPGIKPDTLVLLNEDALNFYADNSLSPALNWIYAPDNRSSHIDYVLFYPTTRLRNALPKLEPGLPVFYDYLAGEFNSNTSQTLAMYYAPPGCLRILDSEVEHLNRMIPETSLMRFAANLSDLNLIVNEPRAKMPAIYGPEPDHDFCYYFEQADLARQFGDWSAVVKLSERALAFTDHPYNAAEQFVFIEGYAHTDKWIQAMELSQKAYESSPQLVGPMMCRLWRRIGAETTQSPERSAALEKIQTMGACNL